MAETLGMTMGDVLAMDSDERMVHRQAMRARNAKRQAEQTSGGAPGGPQP